MLPETDLRFGRVTSPKWSRAQVTVTTVVTHEIKIVWTRCRMLCLPLNGAIRIEFHCVRNALRLAYLFGLSALSSEINKFEICYRKTALANSEMVPKEI